MIKNQSTMEGDAPPATRVTRACQVEEGNSKPFKLHIPDTKIALQRCSFQIIAFVTSFSTLVCLSLSLLLILQMMIIGYWAKIYHDLTYRMPKSFAWEILIRMFGSLYNDCTDRTGPYPVQLTVSDNCSYDFTMPPLPIIAMTFLIATSLSGIVCLIEGFLYKPTAWTFRLLWVLSFLQFLLFSFGVISIALSFSGDNAAKNRLELRMSNEMEIVTSPSQISPRWELTQSSYECCGINHFYDWKFSAFAKEGNPRYSRSCCDHSKFPCKVYPNRTEVFKIGCLDLEYNRVQTSGMLAIYLLCMGLISTGLMTLLLSLTRTIYNGDGNQKLTFGKNNSSVDNATTYTLVTPQRYDATPIYRSSTNDNLAGGGDFCEHKLPSISPSFNQDPEISYSQNNFNALKWLCLSRQTKISIHINGWGMHVKSETSSGFAHAQTLKLETMV